MIVPDVRYHIQREGLFMCDDRHADSSWFGRFDDPFLCKWTKPRDALQWARPGDVLRVSVDGKLV